MPKIWAFDNRTGAVNEQVTLGRRQRKPASSGLEAFRRHPRIDWRADTPEPAPVPPTKRAAPLPATELERLQRYGTLYSLGEQWLRVIGLDNCSALAELAKRNG
jgi:hypothetical protein